MEDRLALLLHELRSPVAALIAITLPLPLQQTKPGTNPASPSSFEATPV